MPDTDPHPHIVSWRFPAIPDSDLNLWRSFFYERNVGGGNTDISPQLPHSGVLHPVNDRTEKSVQHRQQRFGAGARPSPETALEDRDGGPSSLPSRAEPRNGEGPLQARNDCLYSICHLTSYESRRSAATSFP